MIKTFEEITAPLKPFERATVHSILSVLVAQNGKTITEAPLRNLVTKDTGYPLAPARFRKMINFIRSNSLAPVMATRKGCFISKDKNVIAANVQSLEERASAISNAANGLKHFLDV